MCAYLIDQPVKCAWRFALVGENEVDRQILSVWTNCFWVYRDELCNRMRASSAVSRTLCMTVFDCSLVTVLVQSSRSLTIFSNFSNEQRKGVFSYSSVRSSQKNVMESKTFQRRLSGAFGGMFLGAQLDILAKLQVATLCSHFLCAAFVQLLWHWLCWVHGQENVRSHSCTPFGLVGDKHG